MSMTFDEKISVNPRTIVRQIQAINRAQAEVRSKGIEVTMACDSADQVYFAGLKALGHDVREIAKHPEAAKAAWSYLKNARPARTTRSLAMDAKDRASYLERFPNANRLYKGSY